MMALAALNGRLCAQQYSFASYGQDDGLSNLHVTAIVQDQTGFIWIGTEHGLFRYSGGRVQSYSSSSGLTNQYIYDLFVDRSNRLWAGTDNGLFVSRDVVHPQFEQVGSDERGLVLVGANSAFTNESAFAQLPNGDVLVVADARLWEISPAGAGWGARPYFERHAMTPPAAVTGVLVARDGTVWMGCGSALCHIAGGQLHVWGTERGVLAGRWAELFEDHAGTLWVRDSSDVIALTPGAAAFKNRSYGRGRDRTSVTYLGFAQDQAGRILTLTAAGIARWVPRLQQWELLGAAQGLPQSPISALCVSRDGSPWLGVFGRGLERWLGYDAIQSWTQKSGLASPLVWSVLQISPTQVLIATEKGVDELDPLSARVQPWAPWRSRQSGPAVHYLAQTADGRVWLVTRNGGVFDYDRSTGQIRQWARLPGEEMNHVLADRENRLWIATSRGLYQVSAPSAAGTRQLVKVQDPLFRTDNFFTVVSAPDGTIWCTGSAGMFHLVGGQWHKISPGDTGLDPRMGDLVVNQDGSVWATDYSGGIVRIWVQHGRMVRDRSVRAPVLASDQIVFLSAGRKGWLWVGTDHGVDVYDGRQWRRLSQDNGLLWNDLDLNAFQAAPNGTVWLGTSAGVSELTDPARLFAPEHLRVFVTAAKYAGQQLLGRHGGVPWSRGTLAVDFTALGAPSDTGLRYRYRLQGLENDWSYTSTGEARFPALDSGRYSIEVLAVDAEQHGRSPVVSDSIRILPPWWQAGWARLLAGLMAALLVWVGVRWRERVMRVRQHELEVQVEERTRELESEKRELEAARAELQVQATRDSLTGVWNRPAIMSLLERELCRCGRENSQIGVVMVDLDHFKSINDCLGHRCGDQVLIEAACRFCAAIRPYDGVGRWGGEEFLILLPGLGRTSGEQRLETVRAAISTVPIQTDGGPVPLTCSFGVVWVSGEADWQVVLEQADQALYAAKRAGRDRIEYAGALR